MSIAEDIAVIKDIFKLSLGDYLLIVLGVVMVIMAIAGANKGASAKVVNVIGNASKSGAASAPSVAEAAELAAV